MNTAIQLAQPYALTFTPEQEDMIRATYANGAKPAEFAVLMEIARTRGLNPLLSQVHFVERWSSAQKRNVWSTQISIDGLRAIAQRTGVYGGQDEPEWVDDENGKPIRCTVRVYRKDWERPAVGIAYFAEYVQKTKEGHPTKFWRDMPHVMIAKVAEALAIRKAFPEDTSGLYTGDEMAQAQNADPHIVNAPALAATSPNKPVIPYDPGSSYSDALSEAVRFVLDSDLPTLRRDLKATIAGLCDSEQDKAVVRGALQYRLERDGGAA